ncbi:hypothetical protein R1sor_003783 [Riccia sorocarpa]|uniref:Acetoacetate decarboxylase n=1 Tax=Riccia sorocarpa TaxID=122646 RepID=A0ABD3H4D9_9MARC
MKHEDVAGKELPIRPYAAGPPWNFRGRALYQLNLVKADVARKYIPKELKLVEAFGYTLGGFFLASYDGSPAGAFDEAVIIPGIVWNPPSSCAWAGRVLVGSEEARDHGRKEVGLPSFAASFSYSARQKDRNGSFPLCTMDGLPANLMASAKAGEKEQSRLIRTRGPMIRLNLPNFSGQTKEQPNLLKYSCRLSCIASTVKPVKVIAPLTNEDFTEETEDMLKVMTGKPLVSIFFDSMKMRVEAPVVVDVKLSDELQQQAKSPSPAPAVPGASAS